MAQACPRGGESGGATAELNFSPERSYSQRGGQGGSPKTSGAASGRAPWLRTFTWAAGGTAQKEG